MQRASLVLLFSILSFQFSIAVAAVPAPGDYFRIQVIDEQTKRGIPLVELETPNSIRYWTDSNGLVAFHEPGLMDQEVFFLVRSHGYEYPKDGFGYAGKRLKVSPGGKAVLEMKRINIAERLYRITGQGIYRDTVLLGEKPPLKRPLLAGRVVGSDSVVPAVYKNRIFWFWGDTGWPAYPLGNFNVTGATSLLPGKGGLDPDVGVDLEYFVRDNGFAKEMAPMPGKGPTWIFGLTVFKDGQQERMLAAYSKIKDASMETYERGLCMYNDDKDVFEKFAVWKLDHPIHPGGQTVLRKEGGKEYVFFLTPFPLVRVPASIEAMKDLDNYEAFTCLKEGTTLKDAQIDRGPDGTARYTWKRNTPPLSNKDEADLVKDGKLKADEALFYLRDADTGKAILAHAGSVYWNDYRKRWVLIDCENFGTSLLGETWYAEADTPLGPWVYARKIVTHNNYSFYNPTQHTFFDKDGGRVIYFEGTYTYTFSGNPLPTPRYDYNQIMYKLDLADPRLVLPVPVYELTGPGGGGAFATRNRVPKGLEVGPIVFFAPDRTGPAVKPVYEVSGGAGTMLTLAVDGHEPSPGARPLFYALPPDTKNPPATTIALLDSVDHDGHHHYATSGDGKPVCLVWRSPISPAASQDGRWNARQ